jgi:hypothetical protein
MNVKRFNPDAKASTAVEPAERWGSWEDAELGRKESFLRRTPAQRLQWLEQMLDLSAIAAKNSSTRSADP